MKRELQTEIATSIILILAALFIALRVTFSPAPLWVIIPVDIICAFVVMATADYLIDLWKGGAV